MSLISLEVPLESVSRIVDSLERIAIAAERVAAYIAPPIEAPTYTKGKPHVSEPNFALIRDIEELNASRERRGEPKLSVTEAAAHLRGSL